MIIKILVRMCNIEVCVMLVERSNLHKIKPMVIHENSGASNWCRHQRSLFFKHIRMTYNFEFFLFSAAL